ncbi:MAG: hypothetical protein AAB209_09940, partial [Bacteroidota bacterium]
ISKDVNVGKALGTIAMLFVGLFAPLSLLANVIPDTAQVTDFRIFIVVLVMVILLRLIQPVKEYFLNRNS